MTNPITPEEKEMYADWQLFQLGESPCSFEDYKRMRRESRVNAERMRNGTPQTIGYA